MASPNPTSDMVMISFDSFIDDATVSIYNIAGQKINEVFYKHVSNFKIDLTDFEKGMYFMEVRSANLGGSGVMKIVKK